MPIHIATVNPLVARVRALPGVFYLTSEVADALDTSAATLRRLALAHTDLAPSSTTFYGRLRVDLYNDADVYRLHSHLAAHQSRRGRPRLWTDQERRERRNAYSAAGYHRRRAARLTDSCQSEPHAPTHGVGERGDVRVPAQEAARANPVHPEREGGDR